MVLRTKPHPAEEEVNSSKPEPPRDPVQVKIQPADPTQRKIGGIFSFPGTVFRIVNEMTTPMQVWWQRVIKVGKDAYRPGGRQRGEMLAPRQGLIIGALTGERIFLETPAVIAGGTLSVDEARAVEMSLELPPIALRIQRREKILTRRGEK